MTSTIDSIENVGSSKRKVNEEMNDGESLNISGQEPSTQLYLIVVDPPNKRARAFQVPEISHASTTELLLAYSPEDVASRREAYVDNPKKEALSPRISPTPPALELAKQAAILAAKTRKHNHDNRVSNGTRVELEKLRVERDEARAEREGMRAERDAAVESSRKLQRELQELKDKGEKSGKILRLVTASLQSLQDSSEED
jgi:hypothetical protein